jgi:nicotinate-nucleotide--dimethylbenzimidazole phosphoribosyltransferase
LFNELPWSDPGSGEGTGAALAMNVLAAARAVLTEVATFEEAMVATADK